MATSIAQHIAEETEQLTPENQQRVLTYVEQLLAVQNDLPAAKLLRFAGLIPTEDLEAIEAAIEAAHTQTEP